MNSNNFKILIVDDQIFNINALTMIIKAKTLIDTDTVIRSAISGIDALQIIKDDVQENQGKRCSYNLILMDCQMPHMDGYQACHLIRQFLYESGLQQPIISAVTGHAE